MGGGGVASCCFPTEEVKTRWIDGRDPGIRRLIEKGVSNGKYQQAKTSSTVYTKCRHRADVGCWCSPSLDRRRKYVLVLLPHFQVKPSRQLHSALVKEHISERKHLSSSSVISYVNLKAVYAHRATKVTEWKVIHPQGMLPLCLVMVSHAVRTLVLCERWVQLHQAAREARDDIYFVAKAPLEDDRSPAGLFRYPDKLITLLCFRLLLSDYKASTPGQEVFRLFVPIRCYK